MAVSIFDDKKVIPDDSMLPPILKEAQSFWDEAIQHVQETCGAVQGEWKYYTKAAGWTYVVKYKKRTMFYLFPKDAHLQATFVFGAKAAAAAEESDLPADVKESLRNAKVYVEGRSIVILVKNTSDLEVLKKLLVIKANH